MSTQDALGFSEESFDQIKIGMNTNEISRILGTPLDVSRISTNVQEWHYTLPKEPIDGWGTWDMRYVVVSNRVVFEVVRAKNENH